MVIHHGINIDFDEKSSYHDKRRKGKHKGKRFK